MSTFPCPSCKTAYRLSAAHLGRKVRCKVCKTVFVLGQDVISNDSKQSSDLISVARGIAHTRMESVTQQIQKRSGSSRPGRMDSMARNKLRSVMARKLHSLQDAALAVAPSQSAQLAEAQLGARTRGNFTAVKTSAPDQRLARGLLLGMLAGILLVVALLAWQLGSVGSGRSAAEQWSQAVRSETPFPARHHQALESCWAEGIGQRPLLLPLDAGQAQFDPVRSFSGRELAATIGSLLDQHVRISRADCFVPIEALQRHPDLIALPKGEAIRTALADAGVRVIDRDAIIAQLAGLGVEGDRRLVVLSMLFGSQGDGRPSAATKRLLAGNWPEHWYYQRFRHDAGSLLIIDDDSYDTRQGLGYEGIMAYCSGDGWPHRWLVLDCAERLSAP